ncbi:DNA-3-methyladenine glycosylase [Rickettsia prowazekii]|uniref:Putative 3-methyladenine DNA glycosylase n=2 Tax=Rickettsia prowazekii TaxID=782 RepID=3MGH_RICPR|nr:DNA-3-methyladenine glycosylase [Rickettsia prowazekii]Q9ZDH7.1 RecName: Full=Putative 3-methyladenine DNA glycosylase [Rickettsia prowazekii str. Madrid E]ADE29875.1 DNA-3-methyladenine glycosidase [Rickettsia prowazekii str. Rp22]AFE49167.1 3-methyladenine DNA glycosylase [Rickettsia prowazekii str. Chernikova]AFE50013.1 3-methyladenine DNA glycosylase [Rickettsia prowazekii str. Katsinyian]AFE50857.1 3-methyladenine DNA glycosylase [Rickettsia prowazekii str. BuV67-CWPP]AFE51695.1 3-met
MNKLIPLPREFFARDTNLVSTELIGKVLYFQGTTAIITETESYIGEDDPACHAARGRTKRTDVMFGPAGFSYVYLIYGMYYCLNFVTEDEGFPAATLIRGVYVISHNNVYTIDTAKIKSQITDEKTQSIIIRKNRRIMKFYIPNLKASNLYLNGPGKLCKYLGINTSYNKCDLINNKDFFVSDIGLNLPYYSTTRIGITKGTDKLWRYIVTDPKMLY